MLKLVHLITILITISVPTWAQNNVQKVASFKGIQVTGVTVTDKGRMFANFPRWRTGVPFSVVEVFADGSYKPYPNGNLNSWEVGQPVSEKFIGVQSVLAINDELFILETSNPMFAGCIASPRVYVYNLKTNTLKTTYSIPETVLQKGSYINDLRVDSERKKIYFTDSGAAGLIILDIKTNSFTRVLDNHPFTKAEVGQLSFGGKIWKKAAHSDGIELDTKNDILYFHALTGYTLYGIKVVDLLSPSKLRTVKPFQIKTGALDGMIIDKKGNLYFADLENNKIQYLMPDRKTIKTLAEGDAIRWADTFGLYDGYLYFSNSRINEAQGDISNLEFTINRIKLP